MAAFKNNRALLVVVALSSLFLSLTFANDLSSPTAAPTVAEVEGPSHSSGAPESEVEVEGPSPSAEAPESELASSPSPVVSFISSSPDHSPASAPSPLPSESSSSSSSSSEDDAVETYSVLDTTVTAPLDIPAAGKDVQNQVSKVVQSSVISVKSKTEFFMKDVIAKRLDDPTIDRDTRECLKQCKENYIDASDDISKVMDDLSSGDYYKARVDVEGISTFVDTCNDCLKEMVGDDPEFKKFDDWVRGVTGDCLDQLDKINS